MWLKIFTGTSGRSMWAELERLICSSLFLWHPLHAPLSLKHHLECPLTAPLPLTPFSARCPPFPLRSALTCAALTHASAKRCQLWRLKPSLSKAATSTFSLFIYLFICSETTPSILQEWSSKNWQAKQRLKV